MDLQVAIIILIVFLVSFMSYLFISKFLPHGKTFDEMIAEKKRLREEMLGATKASSMKSSKIPGSKKKPKKKVSIVERAPERINQSESEEDIEMIEEQILKDAQKVSLNKRKFNKKKQQQKEDNAEATLLSQSTSEEFDDAILSSTIESVGNKNSNKKRGNNKSGILINKNEPIYLKETQIAENENHFEEIHPKDAIEIQHSSVPSDEKNLKNFRDVAKKAKKQTPPVSPKNQKKIDEVIVKKKRSADTAVAAIVDGNELDVDESEITPMIRELSKIELTKTQIQVLIDFLLNKQSDTITKDPTEWTEGKSDLVQKLKKQLQEKEAQLKNEQDALSGMQIKLKDLRAEFNNEKIQFNLTIKTQMEHLHNSKSEVKALQAEIQYLSEKHNNEKQSMTVSLKQLQQKYIQVSENLKLYENLPSIQQIQADNQILQNEIINKNQQIVEFKAFADESRQKEDAYKQKIAELDNKFKEIEIRLRKKDENIHNLENEIRQRVQDLSNRDSEIQKLNGEIAHMKDILQLHANEKEQLNQEISSIYNSHSEESKIEIKNLQNALDSTKKELEAQRIMVNDYKVKLEDLNTQVMMESKQLTQKSGDSFLLNEKINEITLNHQDIIKEKDKQLSELKTQIEILQKAESEFSKQIEEQKSKNNDLRQKNWKLVDALQSVQTSSMSIINANKLNPVVHSNSINLKVVIDLIEEFFPDYSSKFSLDDEIKWLKSVLENLKIQLASNNHSNHSNSTSSLNINNANHHLNKSANNVSNNNNTNNNCNDLEKNNINTNTLNGDTNSTLSSSASCIDNELILIQNAQLKTTVDEYKNIIAETESMLKNLESKVREQDAYWTKVVLMKDNEISNLKNNVEQQS